MMDAVRTCRDCGCTAATACPGGCSWVEADLCSACHRPTRQRLAIVREKVLRSIDMAAFAMCALTELASRPQLLDPPWNIVVEELAVDNCVGGLVQALRYAIEAFGDRPDTAALIATLNAFSDGLEHPDTAEGDAAGSPAVQPPPAAQEPFSMALNQTQAGAVLTVLTALVNAGGVRPEDLTTVNTALTALEAEETDHETRITALEDFVDNLGADLSSAGSGSSSATDTGSAGVISGGSTTSDTGSASVISGGSASADTGSASVLSGGTTSGDPDPSTTSSGTATQAATSL
jgi:hypothetical protein